MDALNLPKKNSILKRPIRRTAGKANQETGDEQFRLEQEKLSSRKAKRQQLAEIRTAMMYGDKYEKAKVFNKEKETIEHHLTIKQQQHQNEKEQDQMIANQMKKHYETLNRTENAQNEARKNYNQQLLSENMRLLEYREKLKKRQRAEEIQNDIKINHDFKQQWKPSAF